MESNIAPRGGASVAYTRRIDLRKSMLILRSETPQAAHSRTALKFPK
jgi:hypothetical protein